MSQNFHNEIYPIGELVVIALKAEHLPMANAPYCSFTVGNTTKKTVPDINAGSDPIWDDQVNIPIFHPSQCELIVKVYGHTGFPLSPISTGIVDLRAVIRDKEEDGYFKLSEGEIYLEMTYYPAQNTPRPQQQNTARPQQQIRYQHPPGHAPGNVQPSTQYGRVPPTHQQQFRPMQQQIPPLQAQIRPPPPQQQRPPPQVQTRPPPQTPRPMYPPWSTPSHQQSPSPFQPRPPQQQRPLPPLPQHQPQHNQGALPNYTLQLITPSNNATPSPQQSPPQPLLSAPYVPVASPASKHSNMNYPPQGGYPPVNSGPLPPNHGHLPHNHGYPPPNNGYPPSGFRNPLPPQMPQPSNNQILMPRPPPPQGGKYPGNGYDGYPPY